MVLFRKLARLLCVVVALGGGVPAVTAGETTVATAASFAGVLAELARDFEAARGDHVVIVTGSSGKLASQILLGAPFDIFLSADQARPAAVIAGGLAAPDDRFTYAVGRLALWSSDAHLLAAGGRAYLEKAGSRPLALANPKLAPYGVAAMETLEALGLGETVKARLVYGENVGQAFALARSGAAEAAFVAWSDALSPEGGKGSRWLVPEALHRPLRQDGVLLARGKSNPAAVAFIAFLASMRARSVIEQAGFDSAGG